MIKVNCNYCNKNIYKRRNKYCNRECYGKYLKINRLGTNNPFYGKKHTKQTKLKLKYPKSLEHRIKLSDSRKGRFVGDKNHRWKGNNVGYISLHKWIRKNKPKSDRCKRCKTTTNKLDVANISGQYKRDVNDFEWLCKKCHLIIDKINPKRPNLLFINDKKFQKKNIKLLESINNIAGRII